MSGYFYIKDKQPGTNIVLNKHVSYNILAGSFNFDSMNVCISKSNKKFAIQSLKIYVLAVEYRKGYSELSHVYLVMFLTWSYQKYV